MPVALGYESYVAVGMQTAFRTAAVPTITIPHLREGNPISPGNGIMPRISTVSVFPKSSQTWNVAKLTPFSYKTELAGNPTAWLPILRGAWGHELKAGAGPVTHTYNVNNPPVDGGTDDATNFYNHALTFRHTLTGVATYEVNDCCIDQWTWEHRANATTQMGWSGTGGPVATASAVSFTDISGTTFSWEHDVAGANSGIYLGTANPPTTAIIARSFLFILNNNLRFEPFLGAAVNQHLALPTRTDFPTASFAIEGDFDDISATDAVVIWAAFVANTKHNLRAKAYIDANNSWELLASGATAPVIYDDPKINASGNGPVGFSVTGRIYPETASTDLKLIVTTLT